MNIAVGFKIQFGRKQNILEIDWKSKINFEVRMLVCLATKSGRNKPFQVMFNRLVAILSTLYNQAFSLITVLTAHFEL
jgi:hypothetical protein